MFPGDLVCAQGISRVSRVRIYGAGRPAVWRVGSDFSMELALRSNSTDVPMDEPYNHVKTIHDFHNSRT